MNTWRGAARGAPAAMFAAAAVVFLIPVVVSATRDDPAAGFDCSDRLGRLQTAIEDLEWPLSAARSAADPIPHTRLAMQQWVYVAASTAGYEDCGDWVRVRGEVAALHDELWSLWTACQEAFGGGHNNAPTYRAAWQCGAVPGWPTGL